jgi:hypothetical protein
MGAQNIVVGLKNGEHIRGIHSLRDYWLHDDLLTYNFTDKLGNRVKAYRWNIQYVNTIKPDEEQYNGST